jgi:two-component system, chemotaxis family, chemotaxis protein CheY
MFPTNSKILIVDDMPTIVDLLKIQLKALGYKNISEAYDGEEALNYIVQNTTVRSPIDLIISDWNMPKMTGLDLLKRIRMSPEWSKTPFILLTSESERDQVTEAVLAGVTNYIVKPFTSKLLEEKLKSAWLKNHPQTKT